MIAHWLDEAKIQMFVTQCYIVWPGPYNLAHPKTCGATSNT